MGATTQFYDDIVSRVSITGDLIELYPLVYESNTIVLSAEYGFCVYTIAYHFGNNCAVFSLFMDDHTVKEEVELLTFYLTIAPMSTDSLIQEYIQQIFNDLMVSLINNHEEITLNRSYDYSAMGLS